MRLFVTPVSQLPIERPLTLHCLGRITEIGDDLPLPDRREAPWASDGQGCSDSGC